MYSGFVWARRALNRPTRRFPGRADGCWIGLHEPAGSELWEWTDGTALASGDYANWVNPGAHENNPLFGYHYAAGQTLGMVPPLAPTSERSDSVLDSCISRLGMANMAPGRPAGCGRLVPTLALPPG